MDKGQKAARGILIFFTFFIGVGALFGGACMLIDSSGAIMGMDVLLSYFAKLPFSEALFQNYVFSGIALIIVNCLTQLIAAVLLIKKHTFAEKWALVCGILLMLWICIQFYMFPLNFMSTIYFFFGLIEAVCAVIVIRKRARA